MDLLIIILLLIISLILICIIYGFNLKTLKKIKKFENGYQKLDDLVSKYPTNTEICKYILNKLKNNDVIIEENKEYKSSLYIATINKIIIANIDKSFTRIQTIAHECLHSIQNKKVLLFNFIYSNLYLISFVILSILGILKYIPNNYKIFVITIFLIMGYLYYFIRSFLENDAMIKAKFLSKEYMEELKISTQKEINEIIDKYDELYNYGVPLTNFNLFLGTMIKTIILALIFIVVH